MENRQPGDQQSTGSPAGNPPDEAGDANIYYINYSFTIPGFEGSAETDSGAEGNGSTANSSRTASDLFSSPTPAVFLSHPPNLFGTPSTTRSGSGSPDARPTSTQPASTTAPRPAINWIDVPLPGDFFTRGLGSGETLFIGDRDQRFSPFMNGPRPSDQEEVPSADRPEQPQTPRDSQRRTNLGIEDIIRRIREHQTRNGQGQPNTFFYSGSVPVTFDHNLFSGLFGRFGEQPKPRASQRAIDKLASVDLDSLEESERSCPICFEPYDIPSPSSTDAQDTATNQDEVSGSATDDPPESFPTESGEDSNSENAGTSDSKPSESTDSHIVVEMPCHHRFGLSCIKEWLSSSVACPLCRTTVESHDEYLRSTGQAPDHDTQSPSGARLFDFIFNVVPSLFPQLATNPGSSPSATTSPAAGSSPLAASENSPSATGASTAPSTEDNQQSTGLVQSPVTSSSSAAPTTTAEAAEDVAMRTPPELPPRQGVVRTLTTRRQGGVELLRPGSLNLSRIQRAHPYLGRALRRTTTRSCTCGSMAFCVDHQIAHGTLPPLARQHMLEGQPGYRLISLVCGHTYHRNCLSATIRINGGEPPDLATANVPEVPVWCVRCGRQEQISSSLT